MKNKLTIILFLLLGTVYSIFGQNITDALNYSSDSYQGTARFTSMSGAFGALGGDLSAIAVNPAGSAIFNNGHFSISFGSDSKANSASVLNSKNEFTKNNITLNAGNSGTLGRIILGLLVNSENKIKNGLDIIKSLSEISGFLSSNSEARRALKENSVSVNKTKVNEGYKLTNADLINNKYIVLNRGKKKTFIIKVG